MNVVSTIGIAHPVAVYIAEFHPADLAHDDGRWGQLNRGGTTATDVNGGLQRAARPSVGTVGHAFALVRHIAWGRNHEAILDLGAA